MRKILVRFVIVGVLGLLVWGGYSAYQAMPARQQQVATARVRQGDVIVRSYARGELRAVRSATLVAPNLFGTVQLTRLAPLGAFAKEKDLIVEFDDSEVRSRLEEKELEIEQVEERIKKAQADLAIRNNQDQVELLRARYAVRRAELEVKRNELLPDIDRKKNLLNLDEAKRRLQQLEVDIKSRLEQAQAEMAVLNETKNRAVLELNREKSRLTQTKLLSPMAGLVAVRQNRGPFMFPGMTIPDFREGDQCQPGMPVADVLDVSELELVAKVGELDRANLREGQDVKIKLDAIGDKEFRGQIKNLSGTASANVFSSDPAKKFDVVFSLDMKELLEGLGAKAEQIRKVLATAEANRKKPPLPSMGMFAGGGMMGAGEGGGMAGGGGRAVMNFGGPGGGAEGAGGQAGQGGRPGGGERRQMFTMGGGQGGGQGGGISEADRQKMREAMQKALKGRNMQDLSPEERQKIFEEVRKAVPAMASRRPQGGGERGAGGERNAQGGQSGREGRGGEGGPPQGGLRMLAGRGGTPPGMGGAGQFSQKDLDDAKLPEPVDEDNQLDVLLRPGLLADIQIIVEKIPNAIHIPVQAVVEKEGKQIVYVKQGSKFEEREIKPAKRSESTLVIARGLKAGEIIALADPTAKPGEKKKESPGAAGGSSGGALGGMPAGGRGGRR